MEDETRPDRGDQLDDDYPAILAWLRVQFAEDLAVLKAFGADRRPGGRHLVGSGPWDIRSLGRDFATLDVVVDAIDRSTLTTGTVHAALVDDVNRILARCRHRSGYGSWQPHG